MSFPQTPHTLIERLASGGTDQDWGEFVQDYWMPICRFAMRRANANLDDAEDVASQTFEVLLRNQLLPRWISGQNAKLRTLLCGIVCKVQSNHWRVQSRRQQFLNQWKAEIHAGRVPAQSSEDADVFYAAWAEGLLQRTISDLADSYHREGKGDYFRVLYGRLCEQLSIAEVAEALEIKRTDVDNYYRHVRSRLSQALKRSLRKQVQRYTAEEEISQEFAAEWDRLGKYLSDCGGLEQVVQAVYESRDPVDFEARQAAKLKDSLVRLAPFLKKDRSRPS